jgi:hypothetical protein
MEKAIILCVCPLSWECWSLKHDAMRKMSFIFGVGIRLVLLWSFGSSSYLLSYYSSLTVPVKL